MSSIHTKSSSKKKYTPLFADNEHYEYDSSPPTSPVRRSAAYARIRKGRAPARLKDSDGTQIVVRNDVPDTPAATVGPVASASRVDDPNLSGVCPPLPGRFVEPFPLAWQEGFHVITGGSKVGITPHWAVAQDAIRCERPCHKKLPTFALAVEYYGVCHAAGVVHLRPARPLPQVSPASPDRSPDRKRQRTLERPRFFARRTGPPPRTPFARPVHWAPALAGSVSQPISVPSSPDVGGSLLPPPIIARSRPVVLCSDSDSDDPNPGYSAARQLSPTPTTLDPRVVFPRDAAAFAHDAADSGDDASVDMDTDEDGTGDVESEDEEEGFSVVGADVSVNNNSNSTSDDDSAITISDDDSAITISDDSASDNNSDIAVSDNDDDDDDFFSVGETFDDSDGVQPTTTLPSSNNGNRPALHITTNPATPTTTISSSLVVEDGSDEDWGFSSIEDPDFIRAIGHALDDPFGSGNGDGRD